MSFELITRTYSTSQNPDKVIIAIHGWEGDEYVFEQVAKLINQENAKWYFPRAPYRAGSDNGNSWFGGNDEDGWKFEKNKEKDIIKERIVENGWRKYFCVSF